MAQLVSRFRRLRPVGAAARGRLLQQDERVVAHPRPPLRRGADRRGFTIVDDIDPVLKRRCEEFLAQNEIEVAGIEFIRDAAGAAYTYDVNTNTNYNPEAEARSGRSAMTALARFLGDELARVAGRREAAE